MARELLGLMVRPAALMVLPLLGVMLPLLAVADFVESRVQARRALAVCGSGTGGVPAVAAGGITTGAYKTEAPPLATPIQEQAKAEVVGR
jgi:hypothetical protein